MEIALGTDLVQVSAFAAQLGLPGSTFAQVFTDRERRDSSKNQAQRAHSLAARWAAKEAFIKAWSQMYHSRPPVIEPDQVDWQEVELVVDRWRRPALRFHGKIAHALAEGGSQTRWQVSLSHDGDYALAAVMALYESPPR